MHPDGQRFLMAQLANARAMMGSGAPEHVELTMASFDGAVDALIAVGAANRAEGRAWRARMAEALGFDALAPKTHAAARRRDATTDTE